MAACMVSAHTLLFDKVIDVQKVSFFVRCKVAIGRLSAHSEFKLVVFVAALQGGFYVP